MPKISAGNRLYLYQLLTRELGRGKQTPLARAEEALTADGIWPEDLGCADARTLFDALDDVVKVTLFKKGVVYVTVVANEEYDAALERADEKTPGEKAASKGKPWKKRGGPKNLKPLKPKHVEKPAPAAELEPIIEPEVVDEKNVEAAEDAPEVEAVEAAAAVDPEAADDTPEPEAAGAPELAAEPDATPEEAPEETVAQAEPEHTPSISLTITYTPEPLPEPEPEPEPAAEPAIKPLPTPAVPPRPKVVLPEDFYREVRCPDEQLSALYQVLPLDVDPMDTLEEDFRMARASGTIEGTRSMATFPLRFARVDGTPVTVTLRRSSKATAGKYWTLAEVDAGSEDVDFDGLGQREEHGPWSAFGSVDLLRELSEFAHLGDWEHTGEELGRVSAPEDWGEGRALLRDYLAMTFHRVRSEGKLVETDSVAAFDTGLLTSDDAPIIATFSPREGEPAWGFTGFETIIEGIDPVPARYVTRLADVTIDPALPVADKHLSHAVARALRSPRVATPAYNAAADEVVVLLPQGDGAVALRAGRDDYEVVATLSLADARACARVVSGDLPAWLR